MMIAAEDGRERTDAPIESTKARVSLVMNYSAVKAVHSRGDQGIGGNEIFRMFSDRSSRVRSTERVSESEIAPEYRKLTSRNVFRDVAVESSFRNAIMPRAVSHAFLGLLSILFCTSHVVRIRQES